MPGDALTQGSLDQPSEFQDSIWSLEYLDFAPLIDYIDNSSYPPMTFSEPSIENKAGFGEISFDQRFWPGSTNVQGITDLEQNLPITWDPSQRQEASSSFSSSLDSLFAPQTTLQNYTTPNTDTVFYHSPTSDGFSTTLTQAPFAASIPLLPTSPVRRKRDSSSVSPASTVDGGGRISKPKQRLIKHQPNGGKAPTTLQQQMLRSLIDAPGTGVYHGHIASAEAAAADQTELARMFRRAPRLCTSLSSDATFPAHDADSQKYVRDLYDAIWDWSDYVEMDKTLGSASMSALEPGDMPSRAEQQKKMLSKPLNDYVVEQLCWRLL
ncbi:hypothetical protein MY11210_007974, partial [Beauveria gryllotalpidicola]